MKNRGFDFGDFEITKREILASISIIAMMLLIGFVISGRISNNRGTLQYAYTNRHYNRF